jgi:flagellar biosynthesis/type III secretory pathway chaperone
MMEEIARPLEKLIGELRELLEIERRALLSGSSEAINSVARRKMLLADLIESETGRAGAVRPGSDTLSELARYNQENGIICTAMLRHLTAAIDRLRRHDPHRSYMSDGREQICSAQHALGAA